MSTLQKEAIRLVMRIDEKLEPLEDTDFPQSSNLYKKLKRLIEHAEKRQFRRLKQN